MGTTPNYSLPTPNDGDQWNLVTDLDALALATDTAIKGVADSSKNASNITSGTLAIANGGTGATTLAGAKTALGITTLFSFTSAGYCYLNNGLIMQWGLTPSVNANTNTNFTFPIAFPNAALSVTGVARAGSGFAAGANENILTNTYAQMNHNVSASTEIRVIAIGY